MDKEAKSDVRPEPEVEVGMDATLHFELVQDTLQFLA